MSQGAELTEKQVDAVRRALLVGGFSVAGVNATLFTSSATGGVLAASNATKQLAVNYEFTRALNEEARKIRAFELQLLKREFPSPVARAKPKSKSKHQRRKERGW
jgi:hypothetical protein